MLEVGLPTRTVNKNVVEEDEHEPPQLRLEDDLYYGLMYNKAKWPCNCVHVPYMNEIGIFVLLHLN